ncbi:hypothetical protein ACS0TY_004206 [Phlomoides rotata]
MLMTRRGLQNRRKSSMLFSMKMMKMVLMKMMSGLNAFKNIFSRWSLKKEIRDWEQGNFIFACEEYFKRLQSQREATYVPGPGFIIPKDNSTRPLQAMRLVAGEKWGDIVEFAPPKHGDNSDL